MLSQIIPSSDIPSLKQSSQQPVETSPFSLIIHYWWVFAIGLILRTITILQTSNVDQYLPVKYTDVDYLVFSDASSLLHQGLSPYDRSTYRYSPLLAYILLPNITLHEQFGKHLFSICDIIVSVLIYRLLLHLSHLKITPHLTPQQALYYTCFYLFNPLSVNLSTRGSMDVMHITLLYFFLLFFYNQYYKTAAVFYGLSIHLRIYPFIFAIPILLTLYMIVKQQQKGENGNNSTPDPQTALSTIYDVIQTSFKSKTIIEFVGTVIILNIALLFVFYQQFGFKFLYETYLFHIIRKDSRHNFSPWFLFTYLFLDYSQITAMFGEALETYDLSFVTIVKFAKLCLVTIPQLIFYVLLSVSPLLFQKFSSNALNDCRKAPLKAYPLPIIILVMSLFFIATNGVLTAQYFLWFIAFVPLYFPFLFSTEVTQFSDDTTSPISKFLISHKIFIKFFLSCALWFISELLWLSAGFFVEVRGIGDQAWIFMAIASLWLFMIHCFLCIMMFAHVYGVSLQIRTNPLRLHVQHYAKTDSNNEKNVEFIVINNKKIK